MKRLVPAWLTLFLFSARIFSAQSTDPAYWRGLGARLESESRWSEALAAWERVLDQAHSSPADASAAIAHIRALHARLPANTNPEKTHVWRARFLVVRSLDVNIADASSTPHHVTTRFTDDEMATLARARENFMLEVLEYSRGRLRIAGDVIELTTPLARLSGGKGKYWLGPECLTSQFPEALASGDYDGVMAWCKADGVPRLLWGGTLGDGAWDGPPACFSSIQYTSADLSDTGEVELHEWLHQLHLSLYSHHGFPFTPESDGGRDAGAPPDSGYAYYRRPPGEKSWLPCYRSMMGEAITARMYACASIRHITETQWNQGWVHDWKVLHFDPARVRDPDQVAPTQSAEWKTCTSDRRYASARGLLPDRQADSVYAQAEVECAHESDAQLAVGFLGSGSVWWNGERVLDFAPSPGNPLVSHLKIPVVMSAGKNVLLLRIETDGAPAQWSAGLTAPDGFPLP